jgi:hypothetical protein
MYSYTEALALHAIHRIWNTPGTTLTLPNRLTRLRPSAKAAVDAITDTLANIYDWEVR